MSEQLALETSSARTHSAISVVNALATGKGATIGIDLPCSVTISFTRNARSERISIESRSRDAHDLIRTCIAQTMRFLNARIPDRCSMKVAVHSKIPEAVGLKSSSAVSTAVVKSQLQLGRKKFTDRDILNLSANASILCGASLTGAYDDAGACLLGGLVLADNRRFAIRKHTRVPKVIGTKVIIMIPNGAQRFTSTIDRRVYSHDFKAKLEKAFNYAYKGEITRSMLINSMIQCAALGYSFRPITTALGEGASASGVSGKGPAIAALCSSEKITDRVRRAWHEDFPNSTILRATVIQPQRKIE